MTAAAHSEIFSDSDLGETPAPYGYKCSLRSLDFDTFAGGWAYALRDSASRAHFYTTDLASPPLQGRHGMVKRYRALCGAAAAATRSTPLYEAGKATRCARCMRAAAALEQAGQS